MHHSSDLLVTHNHPFTEATAPSNMKTAQSRFLLGSFKCERVCVCVCVCVWRRVVGCSGVWRCVVVCGGVWKRVEVV